MKIEAKELIKYIQEPYIMCWNNMWFACYGRMEIIKKEVTGAGYQTHQLSSINIKEEDRGTQYYRDGENKIYKIEKEVKWNISEV